MMVLGAVYQSAATGVRVKIDDDLITALRNVRLA
jgi:hypothetical protein